MNIDNDSPTYPSYDETEGVSWGEVPAFYPGPLEPLPQPSLPALASRLQRMTGYPVNDLTAPTFIHGIKVLRSAARVHLIDPDTYLQTRAIVRDAFLDVDVELDEVLSEE